MERFRRRPQISKQIITRTLTSSAVLFGDGIPVESAYLLNATARALASQTLLPGPAKRTKSWRCDDEVLLGTVALALAAPQALLISHVLTRRRRRSLWC